ncbi:MAG TPA: Mur ligase family protein [Gaiellaceae bacterium]|nr:Mur ligase family protein [Gaiellaceae bacterium]
MPSAVEWLEALSPWPAEFGLERMHSLLDQLGNPQRRYPAIHVVGTNGKSTATRTIEAALVREDLRVGAYLSPHVTGWSERIRVDGAEAEFEPAIERIRPAAVATGATQFEALTAAALVEFAERAVDVAVVEAGLGGRFDATNVLSAPVVLLTNVGLDHMDVLGSTRPEIAQEKLAVVVADATAVLPDDEFASLVPHARVVIGGAAEAASVFLGRTVAPPDVSLPGRLEHRGDGEIRDGAHNPDGLDWALPRLPARRYTVVASILRDKDVDAMLDRLARVSDRLVATASSNPRALPAGELAARAAGRFANVEAVDDPEAAVATARRHPPVLVTGSLYLLADLAAREERGIK